MSDLPPQWCLSGASQRELFPRNQPMSTDALSSLSGSHTGRPGESQFFSDIYGGLSEVQPLPPATPLPAQNVNNNDSTWGVWRAVCEKGEPSVMNRVEQCDKEPEQVTDEAGAGEGVNNQEKPAEKGANRWYKRRRTAEQHNLCERNRRTRIHEKLKTLQQMVPNTSQSTQSSMLEETIKHIKGLQLFLLMRQLGMGFIPSRILMSGVKNMQTTQCYSPYMPAMSSPAGMGGWPLSPAMGGWPQMPGPGPFPFCFPLANNVPNCTWNPWASNTSGENADPSQSSEPPPCAKTATKGNLGRSDQSSRPPARDSTGTIRNPSSGQSSEPPPRDTTGSNRNIGSGQSSKPPPRATNGSNRNLGSGQSCQPPPSAATGSCQSFEPPPCDITGSRRSLGSGQSFEPPPCDTTGSYRSLGSCQSFELSPFHNSGSNNLGSDQSLELPSGATIVSGRSLGSGHSYEPTPCDITDSNINLGSRQSFQPLPCSPMNGSHGTIGSIQSFIPPTGDIIGSNKNLGSCQSFEPPLANIGSVGSLGSGKSFEPPPCDNIGFSLNLGLSESFEPLPSGSSGSCKSPIPFQSLLEPPRFDNSDSGRSVGPVPPSPQLGGPTDFCCSLDQREPYEPPPDDTGGSFRSLTHVNPSNHSTTIAPNGRFRPPQSSLQLSCKTNSFYGNLDPSLKSLEQLSATDGSFENFLPNLSSPPMPPTVAMLHRVNLGHSSKWNSNAHHPANAQSSANALNCSGTFRTYPSISQGNLNGLAVSEDLEINER